MSVIDAVKAAWKAGKSAYNSAGEEIPDPTPLEAPLGFKPPLPLSEEIRRLMHASVQRDLREAGIESFEEADNFETGEDEDMHSPWEENFEGSEVWLKEQEIRAGVRQAPDLNKSKELIDKTNKFVAEHQAKFNGGGKSTANATQ